MAAAVHVLSHKLETTMGQVMLISEADPPALLNSLEMANLVAVAPRILMLTVTRDHVGGI